MAKTVIPSVKENMVAKAETLESVKRLFIGAQEKCNELSAQYHKMETVEGAKEKLDSIQKLLSANNGHLNTINSYIDSIRLNPNYIHGQIGRVGGGFASASLHEYDIASKHCERPDGRFNISGLDFTGRKWSLDFKSPVLDPGSMSNVQKQNVAELGLKLLHVLILSTLETEKAGITAKVKECEAQVEKLTAIIEEK